MIIGLVFVAIGVLALLIKLDIISGSLWDYVWPIILIILGLSFLWRRGWDWCCPWRAREERNKE